MVVGKDDNNNMESEFFNWRHNLYLNIIIIIIIMMMIIIKSKIFVTKVLAQVSHYGSDLTIGYLDTF
jgi:hypothetical protein